MISQKSSNSNTQKGLVGVLWNFSGSIVQILMQFIVIGILARLLSPEDFGVVAVILIFVNFSNLFTDLGVAAAIVQQENINKLHISAGYTISLIIGISVGIIFYFAAPEIADFFSLESAENAIRFFSIFFPLRSFNSISQALLSRNLKFALLVKCSMAAYLLGTGLISIILAFSDFGYWALIYGQFAGLLITACLMIYFVPPIFSLRFNKEVISQLLFFGSGHTLGTLFNYFGENADNFIVGKTLGPVAMGNYSKGFQLFSIPSSFFGQIYDKVFFPILSQKQKERDKLTRFYLFSISLCFGFLFPISVLLFINAELVVKILLGNQWLEVVSILQILVCGMAFRFGTRINKSYLKSMGIIYRGAYYQFVFAFLMIFFCFLGVYFFNLEGVAYGVFIATFLNYWQMSFRIYKELNFSKYLFLKIHLIAFLVNFPFLICTILLYFLEVQNYLIHLFLTIFIYFPVLVFILSRKFYIIFNPENHLIISQVILSLPGNLQQKLKRKRFFTKYF